MKNFVFYRKVIVLILASVLLTLSIHNVGYTEDITEIIVEVEQHAPLSVNEIYEKSMKSVIWILRSDRGQGSGVLIDKALKLAVTSEHVVDTHETVVVFFPATDGSGKLIEKRDFYDNENNIDVLVRLGIATLGRVVAKNPENDLAILQLEGIPETAVEMDPVHFSSTSIAYSLMNENDRVHILGNPGDLKLWRWTGGFFQDVFTENGKEILLINADTYQGNSGGPVLNERGALIGIVSRSNLRTNTLAIPSKYINDLLKTFETIRVFSIKNTASFTIDYQVKWSESDDWKTTTVKPNTAMNHWSTNERSEGYPMIRFDYVANDGEITYRSYRLETYRRRATPDFEPTRTEDAREYHFEYNYATEILDLRDSEK